ncbi:putative reverse transcriptase domain-containing protein, partial [Tanacetum coccineum]
PLLLPSTASKVDIPKADISPRKRLLLTAPTPTFKVGESSATGAARLPRSTVARRVDNNFVDIVDASIQASERRTMAAIEVVNLRGDHAALRDEEDTLRMYLSSMCTTHEQERVEVRQALDRSEAHNRALEARITVLETQAYRHEWQRQDADDHATGAMIRIHVLEARARIDTLEDTGVADALAECDANRNKNGDDNHDSWSDERRRMHVAHDRKSSQELALLCGRMFPKESDKFATELMDQKIRTLAECQAKNKRKFEDISKNNQNQQQPFKRYNVARAYTARPGEKKPYEGSKPLFLICNYHHEGQCAPRCNKCKKVGHLARDCRGVAANTNTQRGVTCYECGVQGHYKKDCPKLRNKNQRNQAGNGNAMGMAGTNLNSNVVMGTFLLNNRYALILFDAGADRSFVSTAFSSLIDIVPATLDHVPGVAPVAWAPYRLALSEMKELSDQLQELTLGSSSLVCQEEGWIIPDVH